MDGRKQDVSGYHFNPSLGKRTIDPRIGANEAARQVGNPPGFLSVPFHDLLRGLDTVHFGLHTEPGHPGQGWTPLSNAVLANFSILVDEVPAGTGLSRIASVSDDSFKVVTVSGEQLQDLDRAMDSDVFVCGTDKEAKAIVGELIDKIPDLRWVDAGDLTQARIAETMTALLISVNRAYKIHDAGFRVTGRGSWGSPGA